MGKTELIELENLVLKEQVHIKKPWLFFGSDHAGLELKDKMFQYFKGLGYEVYDAGTKTSQSCDYPDIAQSVCMPVLESKKPGMEIDVFGVLFCYSGQGMSRAANGYSDVIAEVAWNVETAKHAREHSNSDILTLGQGSVEPELAKEMILTWLVTPYVPDDRHERRRKKTLDIRRRNPLI